MNTKIYSKESRQTKQHIHTCMFCGQSGAEIGNEQHSTLVEQRDRLVEAARSALQALRDVAKETRVSGHGLEFPLTEQMLESALTTIEQGGKNAGERGRQ